MRRHLSRFPLRSGQAVREFTWNDLGNGGDDHNAHVDVHSHDYTALYTNLIDATENDAGHDAYEIEAHVEVHFHDDIVAHSLGQLAPRRLLRYFLALYSPSIGLFESGHTAHDSE